MLVRTIYSKGMRAAVLLTLGHWTKSYTWVKIIGISGILIQKSLYFTYIDLFLIIKIYYLILIYYLIIKIY